MGKLRPDMLDFEGKIGKNVGGAVGSFEKDGGVEPDWSIRRY